MDVSDVLRAASSGVISREEAKEKFTEWAEGFSHPAREDYWAVRAFELSVISRAEARRYLGYEGE